MSYTVEIAPAARRQLRKLSPPTQRRIVKRLEGLEDDPRPRGVEKLSGLQKLYRIRIGDYRVIYRIEDQILLVLVLKIADRKDAYRELPG